MTGKICPSANEVYMPPMLIFSRKREDKEFEESLPAGRWAKLYESGWMTAEIFLKYLKVLYYSAFLH